MTQLELSRLQILADRMITRAPNDPRAAAVALKLLERRARILGLPMKADG